MQQHELRRQVVSEMHLRRWPMLSVPGHVRQWVLIVDPEDRDAEAAILDERCPAVASLPRPPHRYGYVVPGVHFAWERHSEGSSIALFADGETKALDEAVAWVEQLPGRVVRATSLRLVQDDAAAEALLPEMQFDPSETISCLLAGKARMWADFRLKDDGFGHIVVAANGLNLADFTRLVQRLQDLGNYRNKALLGLPVAQEAWPKLDEAEQRLTDLANRVAGAEETDDVLMGELSALSLDLTAITTAMGYRMSATSAYGQLVRERLEELRVTPIEGYASLVAFTQRRFLPALRTCTSVTERERQLSERAGRLTSLLRARIETRIENQNAKLLRSMDRSSRMQLRLQQLVEGLSVVALSYYLIGLLGYALKGSAHVWPGLDAELVLGLLVVPVVALVWLGVHTAKKKLLGPSN